MLVSWEEAAIESGAGPREEHKDNRRLCEYEMLEDGALFSRVISFWDLEPARYTLHVGVAVLQAAQAGESEHARQPR